MNIGSTDRNFRLLAGLIVMSLSFFLFGGVFTLTGAVLIVIGTTLLLTGVISFCPVYKLLGVSTNKVN